MKNVVNVERKSTIKQSVLIVAQSKLVRLKNKKH